MGDEADRYTDDGITDLAMHQAGECDGPCQYCEEEERQERVRIREKKERLGSRKPVRYDPKFDAANGG